MCLKHAIYGLKEVALAWWKALNKSMVELSFTCLLSNSGIFVNKDKSIITIVYVDNVLFIGPDKKALLHTKKHFIKKWECRDLSKGKEFLCMYIQQKNGKIYLDQTAYLQKVL